MENSILLSIIIPVYNLEKYILPCLESILNNKDISPNIFEIILVNDGSSDNSYMLIKTFINKKPEYKIKIYSQENQGVSSARNLGLKNAKGKYVWFIDGDDAIICDSLNSLTTVIKKFDVDIIHLGKPLQNHLFEDNSIIQQCINKGKAEEYQLIPAYQLFAPSYSFDHKIFLWKRFFLIEHHLQYPLGISQNEDFDFLIHALLKADLAYTNSTFQFYLYREMRKSASRGTYDYLRYDKFIQNKFFVINNIIKLGYKNKKNKYNNLNEKEKLFREYADRYFYLLIADCFFRKIPFSLTLYSIQKLKALGLYPIVRINGVSSLRIFVFNNRYLFLSACWIYKVFKLFF